MSGKEMAEIMNHSGIGSMSLRRMMNSFWIHWDNESSEWQEDFVKTAKPDVLVYVMNHLPR